MRKLASIQQISDIQPIPDADAIEKARVNAWWVVCRKGEYRIGDLAVYCEIDSFIPKTIAPFLTSVTEYNGVLGSRLRTAKLRGQLSQGLLLHLNVLPEEITPEIGLDVSDLLGITKWEPPIPVQLAGQVKGNFPSQVVKTDEERVQNIAADLESDYMNAIFEVTEKLEGSSCQFGLLDNDFVVLSRNVNLAETSANSMWQQARKYNIETKLRELSLHGLMIQCEIVGEGIQGNIYKLKGQDIYAFAVYDTATGEFVSPAKRYEIVKALGLKHVPVLGTVKLQEIGNADSLLEYADGKSALNPSTNREGIVLKQVDGQFHFKAVSNLYLSKQKG